VSVSDQYHFTFIDFYENERTGIGRISACDNRYRLLWIIDAQSLHHSTALRKITSRYHSALSFGVRTCVL
jgi:hypothetical protein